MSHFVYRVTDPDGELLYIGQTKDVERRMADHRRCSSWARRGLVTYEELPDAAQAKLRERELIFAEQPRHNITFKGTRSHRHSPVTVRLPRAQHDALRELAQREHRTFSQEFRRMVELYLVDQLAPDTEAAA